jgi:hypothetical protein
MSPDPDQALVAVRLRILSREAIGMDGQAPLLAPAHCAAEVGRPLESHPARCGVAPQRGLLNHVEKKMIKTIGPKCLAAAFSFAVALGVSVASAHQRALTLE